MQHEEQVVFGFFTTPLDLRWGWFHRSVTAASLLAISSAGHYSLGQEHFTVLETPMAHLFAAEEYSEKHVGACWVILFGCAQVLLEEGRQLILLVSASHCRQVICVILRDTARFSVSFHTSWTALGPM